MSDESKDFHTLAIEALANMESAKTPAMVTIWQTKAITYAILELASQVEWLGLSADRNKSEGKKR